MRSNRARFHAPAPVIIGVVALLLATTPVSAQDVWTPTRWAPIHVVCPPDGRTLDVPDGMQWDPSTCEIQDTMLVESLRFAREHAIAPATAMTLLRAQVDLDAMLARIKEEHRETSAGFQWTWTHDSVTLVARFKGEVPDDVRATLADTGIQVRYFLVDRSWADLERLQAVTAGVIRVRPRITAIDLMDWSVVATVSSAHLTRGDRIRIAIFGMLHPDVRIDIVDGPLGSW